MSLEGTFETLALTEVLEVLSHSKKCGVLLVEAGPADGRIWVEGGRVRAVESGEQTGAVEAPSELLNRAVEVGFTLARQASGSFRFVAGERPPFGSECDVSLGEALDGIQRLLGEWREIQEVIPSLESRARLREELGAAEITLDEGIWRLLVVLDGRRTVRDVVHRSGRTVLEVCHALRDLVERGAIEIVAPVAEVPHGRPAVPRSVVPVSPYGPGVEHQSPPRRRPLGKPMEAGTGPISGLPEIPEIAEPHLGVVVDTLDRPHDEADTTALLDAPPACVDDQDERDEVVVAGDAVDEGEGGRDRRALLRLFSGLRDA